MVIVSSTPPEEIFIKNGNSFNNCASEVAFKSAEVAIKSVGEGEYYRYKLVDKVRLFTRSEIIVESVGKYM